MAILRAPPYIHSCGSNSDGLPSSIGTIPYTSLLYSSTNTEGGGLDISSGIFTSTHPGSYTVTWGLAAYEDTWEYVKIYLQHNGTNIEESLHQSSYHGSNYIYEQGILYYYSYYIILTLYCRRQNNGTTPGPGGHSTALLSRLFCWDLQDHLLCVSLYP